MKRLQAIQILQLQDNFTPEQLKLSYRKLSFINHPDKGGDVEQMKLINTAYNLIKSSVQQAFQFEIWEEIKAKYARYEDIILQDIQTKFQPNNFQDLFESIFKESFTYQVETQGRVSFYNDVYLKSTFKNHDSTIAIIFDVTVNLHQLNRDSILANDTNSYKLIITSYVLANNKKYKLKRVEYSTNTNHNCFIDPLLTFPVDKLQKITNEETKDVSMSKSTFISNLKTRLNSRLNDTMVYIPIGTDNEDLIIKRIVIDRKGYWITLGIGRKLKDDICHTPTKKIKQIKIPESSKSIDFLVRTVNNYQNI